MKKSIKFSLITLLSAVFMACVCIFAVGCTDPVEEDKNFTVTVYEADGTPVNGEESGMQVQLCIPDGACYSENADINANGVATFEIAKLKEFATLIEQKCEFEVHVVNGSTTYALKTPATLTLENTEVSVTLEVYLKVAKVTGNPAKDTRVKGLTERIMEVPLNKETVTETVLGDDGYYHLKNEDGSAGATVYVDLCNEVQRATVGAIKDMNTDAEMGANVFYLAETNANNERIGYYDYNALIAAYAELCNSDGLYPLNADLAKFLNLFKIKFWDVLVVGLENAWLLPCKYYVETNLPTLAEGVNENKTIDNESTAQSFLFSATTGGTYTVVVTDETGDALDYEIYNNDTLEKLFDPATSTEDVCTFNLAKGASILLNFYGTGGTHTITISSISLFVGENTIKIPANAAEVYTPFEYKFTVNADGWYQLLADENIAYVAIDDSWNGIVYDPNDVFVEAEDGTLYSIKFKLEEGEHSVYVAFGYDIPEGVSTVSLKIEETEEPKFAVGEDGNELTLFVDAPVERALDSADEGSYSITVSAANPRAQLGTITITIGTNVITLNADNNYSVDNVTIPAGAYITVETDNDNFGWGSDIILTITLADGSN